MAMPSDIRAYNLYDSKKANEVIPKVLGHLRQPTYFRTALALYRRLQFGRFLDSSYLFTNRQWDTQPGQTKTPWFYAFVDRGCRPETEVWLFGSWEVETTPPNETAPADGPKTKAPTDRAIRTLLLDFIKSIQKMPLPPPIHPPKAILAAQTQLATPSNPPKLPDPTTLLFGAIHHLTVPHLQSLNLLRPPLLPPTPNHTFLFPISALPPPPKILPKNLRWGSLSAVHFPLVRSRTEIARQDFTLASLPHVAIFRSDHPEEENPDPVAWAFVGLDGSLTSLHVESEFRRLGLGRALVLRLFRGGEEGGEGGLMGRFWEDGVEKLAHGNVLVGNSASAGMCEALGAVEGSVVFWVGVRVGGV